MSLVFKQSVWEGVFDSFEHAGGDLDAFESDVWIKKQKVKILRELEQLDNSTLAVSKDYPLPIAVALLLTHQNQVSILDFGGGMGAQYLELLAKVPDAKEKTRYCVIDGEETLNNRPKQLKDFSKLHFSTSLETLKGNFDIIHIGSTLQYIGDWQGLLTYLALNYQPKYFVFSDLLAGDVPTFVTHQIFYDKRIPNWFLNWSEFEGFIRSNLNFSLCFKSQFIHKILNQEEIFPNFDLPATHRIERGLNVIFSRQ